MAKKKVSGKAPKKKAAKKGAAEKPISKADKKPAAFNILERGPGVTQTAQTIMKEIMGRGNNRPTDFKTMYEVRQSFVNARHFYLQWWLGAIGWPKQRPIEIIGPKGAGKTTLAAFIAAAYAELEGAFVLWCEAENKPMPGSRMARSISPNPMIAETILKSMLHIPTLSWEQVDETVLKWVKVMRGELKTGKDQVIIPAHIPLVVVIDPASKLMPPSEAVGFLNYKDSLTGKKSKEKFKETKISHSPEAAKWLQAFCRRLPTLGAQYNTSVIFVWHQNDDVQMGEGGKGGPSFIPAHYLSLSNETHTGGKATGQNAAVIMTLSIAGISKGLDGKARGDRIFAKINKQSYGPKGRMIEWEMRSVHNDQPGWLDPAIHLNESWANWMATNNYLDTKVQNGLFTCACLGVELKTAAEFSHAFHINPTMVDYMGKALRIEGYFDAVEHARSEQAVAAPSSAATEELDTQDGDAGIDLDPSTDE